MLKANNNIKEGDISRQNVYLLFHLCNKNVSIKDHCLKKNKKTSFQINNNRMINQITKRFLCQP